MSSNVTDWVNGIVGSLIYVISGYVKICASVLFSPIRAPLRFFRETKKSEKNQLAPHTVLFISSLLASLSVSRANYRAVAGESARTASGSQRFDDYSLLIITIDAIVIFAICDLVAQMSRVFAGRQPRQRVERLSAIRHYQAAAALALVSAIFVFWPIARFLLPARAAHSWAGWLWDNQWILQLSFLAVILLCVAATRYSAFLRALLQWRWNGRLIAPACMCGIVLFFALSDFPKAYLLRRPEIYLSDFLRESVTEKYPSIAYSDCILKPPRTLTMTSTIVNRGKYVSLIELRGATAAIARGLLAGYFDQEIGWFQNPETIMVHGASPGHDRVAVLKPGDVLTLDVTFKDETAFIKAKSLVEKWQAKKADDNYSYYFDKPFCFLSLQMFNLDKGGGRSVPDFDKNFWDEFGKTAAGDVRID